LKVFCCLKKTSNFNYSIFIFKFGPAFFFRVSFSRIVFWNIYIVFCARIIRG